MNKLESKVDALRMKAELEKIRVDIAASKQLRKRIRTGDIEVEYLKTGGGVTNEK